MAVKNYLDDLNEFSQIIGRHQSRISSTTLKGIIETARALYAQYKSYMEAEIPDLRRMLQMLGELGFQVQNEAQELIQLDSDFRANAKILEDMFEQAELGRIKSLEDLESDNFKTALDLSNREASLWDKVEVQVNVYRNAVNAATRGFQRTP